MVLFTVVSNKLMRTRITSLDHTTVNQKSVIQTLLYLFFYSFRPFLFILFRFLFSFSIHLLSILCYSLFPFHPFRYISLSVSFLPSIPLSLPPFQGNQLPLRLLAASQLLTLFPSLVSTINCLIRLLHQCTNQANYPIFTQPISNKNLD